MNPKPLKLSDEIIDALNEELEYVSKLNDMGRADQEDYGVEGQLITLSTYSRKALDAWTNNAGSEAALHELRKVAAIAIRGLLFAEKCPRRY